MYVNAARFAISCTPAPVKNNKLEFNAVIISIYGSFKEALTSKMRYLRRDITDAPTRQENRPATD